MTRERRPGTVLRSSLHEEEEGLVTETSAKISGAAKASRIRNIDEVQDVSELTERVAG